jgi:radical SAM protein with 4Fe4S-binding SPASM domain
VRQSAIDTADFVNASQQVSDSGGGVSPESSIRRHAVPVNLPVLPNESRQSAPRRPLARGTKTALIEDRQIRLHAPGDRPWERDPANHRDRINVEQHGSTFVVFKPSIGALSALDERDCVAFHVFMAADCDRAALARYFVQMGEAERLAEQRALSLSERFVRDGWTREELPTTEGEPLASVYFTVTRYCDLTCPYCYQGLNDRANTEMTLDQVRLALGRIKDVNPNCRIAVSGGEPFSHRRIHDILDIIDEHDFPIIILSNGTFIDDRAAAHLKSLKRFRYIQISLDGITDETHALTRGKGHFPKAMAAIRSIVAQELPFRLAPTLHNGNMHELPAIGELAVQSGGWLSPNQLKELPHAGLNYTNLAMSTDGLIGALRALNDHLVAKFGLARVLELGNKYSRDDPEVCSVTAPNSRFICGMARSLVDIDWNGDVYPCHLSKGPELLIGNVFQEDFAAIFRRVEERGIRVKSNEIEKCSGCKFVSNCAGGCRAGAWFTHGTLEQEDELCDVNYSSHLRRLLVGAGVS